MRAVSMASLMVYRRAACPSWSESSSSRSCLPGTFLNLEAGSRPSLGVRSFAGIRATRHVTSGLRVPGVDLAGVPLVALCPPLSSVGLTVMAVGGVSLGFAHGTVPVDRHALAQPMSAGASGALEGFPALVVVYAGRTVWTIKRLSLCSAFRAESVSRLALVRGLDSSAARAVDG